MNFQNILSFLKKIGQALRSIFIFLFTDLKRFVIFLLAIACCILFCKCCTAEKELQDTKIRLVESVDTLTTYKNRVGELYAEKETYLTDVKTLKKVNEDLYAEYKKLKDHPVVITKTETIIQIDSVKIADSVHVAIPDEEYYALFAKQDKYFDISGKTTLNIKTGNSITDINHIKIPATFTTDLIESGNKLYFITKSDNPYIQINNIEGAVISPEQSKLLKNKYDKHWAVVAGIGPTVTLVNGNIKCYPGIQITLGYKLISF